MTDMVKAYYPEGGSAQSMVEHFAYGNGEHYEMSRAELIENYPVVGWNEETGDGEPLQRDISVEEFASAREKLLSGDVDAVPYEKLDIRGYAHTGGTLGRSYQDVKGTFVMNENGDVMFEGIMSFTDTWNLNHDDTRNAGANIMTWIGRTALEGTGYPISGKIAVSQNSGGRMYITGDNARTDGETNRINMDSHEPGAVGDTEIKY
jgi:hypothetical protein